jgi:hypothetical protein
MEGCHTGGVVCFVIKICEHVREGILVGEIQKPMHTQKTWIRILARHKKNVRCMD